MVRTSDFESGNPSSNLGKAFQVEPSGNTYGVFMTLDASVAQMVEHLLCIDVRYRLKP